MKPTRRTCTADGRTIRLVAPLLLGALLVASPAAAEVFLVDDIIDAIPAPPGSLRAAIEASEGNGEEDLILFTIDGGTIELVAPLPDLTEGGLRIRLPNFALAPPGSNGIAISGVNGPARAIAIRSSRNAIGNLDFIGFQAGPEVILIAGPAANGNRIQNCAFGRNSAAGGNLGAAVRVRAGLAGAGTPEATRILSNLFVNNSTAIVIDGDGAIAPDARPTVIQGNWFGTDPLGGPGAGNGRAIVASGAGSVRILENRFSGPGLGVTLGSGSDASEVRANVLGLRDSGAGNCSGLTGDALHIDDAPGVVVNRNVITCSSGFGISSPAGPVIDPGPQVLLTCNSIFNNTAGALSFPNVPIAPPALARASAVDVQGSLPDPGPGWIEVFGDNADEARVFQGSLRSSNIDPLFTHFLPVLDLRVDKGNGGAEISFDRSVPANHTALFANELQHESTELSAALGAEPEVRFDIIRGRLANLQFGLGGINLGPVTCLDSDVAPDVVISPNVIDPVDPLPGQGFFYLARKKDPTANVAGTYDPAICLTDIDEFQGPRTPSSGDCPG